MPRLALFSMLLLALFTPTFPALPPRLHLVPPFMVTPLLLGPEMPAVLPTYSVLESRVQPSEGPLWAPHTVGEPSLFGQRGCKNITSGP